MEFIKIDIPNQSSTGTINYYGSSSSSSSAPLNYLPLLPQSSNLAGANGVIKLADTNYLLTDNGWKFSTVNTDGTFTDLMTLDINGNLLVKGEVCAYAVGSFTGGTGSGSGLIQTVYGYSNLGGSFDNSDLGSTFNAYTINQLNSRLITIENKNYLTDLTSELLISTLGYTPYSSNNPSGYVTLSSIPTKLSQLNNDSGFVTGTPWTVAGYLTGINSSQVTTALGYTPYNSTNPSGFITSSSLPTNNNQLTNGAGYITSSALSLYQLASTAINTSNIASQSVNYATNAGNCNGLTHYPSRVDAEWYNVVWASGSPSPMYSCNAVQIQSSTGTIRASDILSTNNNGFHNDAYSPNVPNPIWSIGNSHQYGLAYYQGSALSVGDAIGFHFGNRLAPPFYVSTNGNVYSSGQFIGSGAGLTGIADSLITSGTKRLYSESNMSYYITHSWNGQGWNLYAGNTVSDEQTNIHLVNINGSANTLNNSYTHTNGGDGWWRSAGQAGWYNETYGVGIWATEAGNVRTYNANFISSGNITANGNILATGEVTAYTTSDKRLKKNIKPINNGLSIINKLNPVSYNWNDKAKELNPNKDNKKDVGVIAQELEKVLPNLVHNIYSDEQYKGVDYIKLIPYLIGAIKELTTEINKLKNK